MGTIAVNIVDVELVLMIQANMVIGMVDAKTAPFAPRLKAVQTATPVLSAILKHANIAETTVCA